MRGGVVKRSRATLALLVCCATLSAAQADERVIQVTLGTGDAVRAGEPVELQVRVRDPASGYPLTGLTAADLRDRLTDPALHDALFAFLEAHQPDLLGCAEALGVPPAQLVRPESGT